MIINCLEKMLEFEGHSNQNYRIILLKMFEETGGIQRFDDLQHHPDDGVYHRLEAFIQRFFETT